VSGEGNGGRPPQTATPGRGVVRLHRAARTEDAVRALVNKVLHRRGWRPRVVPYTGYGGDGWVRVLCRVVLAPPGTRRRDLDGRRGWRRFVAASAPNVRVLVRVGDARHEVVSGRGGYVDVELAARLEPGWAAVQLSVGDETPSEAAVNVIDRKVRRGIVSDIDDTVMVTALPRPLVAMWNTFFRRETSRKPVPGMASLYARLLETEPGTPVIYLSTGPWNVAPAIDQFLARHGFPRGPLLMTDWGPTPDSWFRSGQDHKRTQLRRLMRELPDLRWVLVGDDGQHDPQLYAEAAVAAPRQVRAVLIRQLSAIEQVLTHGTPEPLVRTEPTPATAPAARPLDQPASAAAPALVELSGPDGDALLTQARERGLVDPPR